MAEIKLAPNVAVTIDVRYCDVIKGRHVTRLKVKGATVADVGADQEAVLFLDAAPALAEMRAIQACGVVDYDIDAIPEHGVPVKLEHKRLTFVMEQRSGAKRPTLRVSLPGVRASSPEKVGRPETASPAASPAPVLRPADRSTARGVAPALSQSPDSKKARVALYERLTRYALKEVVPIYLDAGVPCDAGAVAAIVEGLYKVEVWHVA